MLKKLIKAYYKYYIEKELAVVERFVSDENSFRHEMNFFDDGRAEAGIEAIKKDCEKIDVEISVLQKRQADGSDDAEISQKLNYLYKRKYEMIYLIAFQASQNFNNVESCKNILEGLSSDFMLCLCALSSYKAGNTESAAQYFKEYLSKHENFSHHYLCNKIYGELLFKECEYDDAFRYLYASVAVCPNDVSLHNKLLEIYRWRGDEHKCQVEKDIISCLTPVAGKGEY